MYRGKIVSAQTAPAGDLVFIREFGQVVAAIDHATAVSGRAAYLLEIERCRREGV
jgi:hypothetical protein